MSALIDKIAIWLQRIGHRVERRSEISLDYFDHSDFIAEFIVRVSETSPTQALLVTSLASVSSMPNESIIDLHANLLRISGDTSWVFFSQREDQLFVQAGFEIAGRDHEDELHFIVLTGSLREIVGRGLSNF